MGLYKQRIRINRQQRRHGKHVRRRFQDPAAAVAAKLQMLKKTTVIFVCRSQILPKKPGAVRRHVIHGVELIAQERRSHEADALLRSFCAYRVRVAERRYKPVKKVTALRGSLNPRFLICACRWRWRSHFPHERTSMLRVCREQPM